MERYLKIGLFTIVFAFISNQVFSYEYEQNNEGNECEQAEDVSECLKDARSVPYIKNGKIQGFKKVEKGNSGVYEKLGIQQGDTITVINQDPENSDY